MPITFHQLTDQGSMIQLPNFQVDSIETLFTPEIINGHPFINQKNIFYTASSVRANDRNILLEQTIVPFDVDNIPASENKSLYVHIFSQFTEIPSSDFITINTGHGLHMLVRTQYPIKYEVAFTTLRKFYHYVCDILDEQFAKANLSGRMDRNIFKKKQLLRMPNTINHKPDKYDVDSLCTYVGGKATPQPLDLLRLSGADKHYVSNSQQVSSTLPPADTEAVMAGCDFMKMCASGVPLSEPQWYGMLGILSKCKDGNKLAHEISALDPRYKYHETQRKYEQADDACKGRLCTSIMELWDGCQACPNRDVVTTPLMLRGEDYIATEHTNFHVEMLVNKKVKMVPVPEDLVRYIMRERNYILFPRTKDHDIYKYTGTHWKEIEQPRLEGYVTDLYRPETPDPSIITKTVKRMFNQTSLMKEGRPTDPSKYISLANGDFCLSTMEFSPHDREHMSFSLVEYGYDPIAKCPKFEKFMSEVFTSPVYINNVLEFFASAMFNLPNRVYDKCLILQGPKDNGKSTVVSIMNEVFGKSNVSPDTMEKESFTKTGGLVDVVVCKLNMTEEAGWTVFSNPQFKNVVTGGSVLLNPKNKSMVKVQFNTKLLFCMNTMPPVRFDVEAIAKRVMLCHMPNVFSDNDPRQNKNLDKEIHSEELPGIFNLLVEAGRRLIARGRYDTSTMEYQQMDELFKISSNEVLAWASEHLEKMDGYSEPVSILYTKYSTYCYENNIRTETSKQFGMTMKTKYKDYGITTNVKGKSARALKGYKLKEDYDGTVQLATGSIDEI